MTPSGTLELGGPFLDAGLPIYIDKPLATSVATARSLFSRQAFEGQLFTCSALRYATELRLDPARRESIGPLRQVLGSSPKRWSRYAVHVIEPALVLIGDAGDIRSHHVEAADGTARLQIEWDSGLRAEFATLGDVEAPIQLNLVGDQGELNIVFEDSFTAFKAALERFVAITKKEAEPVPEREVLRVVELIELGMDAGAT